MLSRSQVAAVVASEQALQHTARVANAVERFMISYICSINTLLEELCHFEMSLEWKSAK